MCRQQPALGCLQRPCLVRVRRCFPRVLRGWCFSLCFVLKHGSINHTPRPWVPGTEFAFGLTLLLPVRRLPPRLSAWSGPQNQGGFAQAIAQLPTGFCQVQLSWEEAASSSALLAGSWTRWTHSMSNSRSMHCYWRVPCCSPRTHPPLHAPRLFPRIPCTMKAPSPAHFLWMTRGHYSSHLTS